MIADSWTGAIASCLQRLEFERRFSPKTLSAYARDLVLLAQFAQESGLVSPAVVTPDHARQFVGVLVRHGLQGRSIARVLAAVRTLYREQELPDHPFKGIKAPRSPRRLPEDLAVDQVQALFVDTPREPLAIRDRAILELFYSAGLRLAELAGLTLQSLDLSAGWARVLGKGGKERLVPIGTPARHALEAWLAVRSAVDPLGPIFTTREGRPLGMRAIQKRVAAFGRQHGLGVPLHPHMLRHSFASHVLQSSGDLRAVQELLGHAHLATTQIYTHLDFQQLAKVYDEAHPRARRRSR